MHAVVFAYVWSISRSLLAAFYHSAFDEVRDTLQQAVGFGVRAENWQAVVLTILGSLLLWKVSRTTERSETALPSGLRLALIDSENDVGGAE